ncbi:MAG: hypothetical protein M1335_07470, partial [Chloroflexi bacterium]|nr:hypothetical protein [Chloroflexota bacterium]
MTSTLYRIIWITLSWFPEAHPIHRLFTGQRLDATGLYFYNARYYDATIARFISPD